MIRVIGAGAFGTALAVSLSRVCPVVLWTRDPDHAVEMQKNRENKRRLPDVHLPENISVSADLDPFDQSKATLLAIPTQQLRGFLERSVELLGNGALVACCKGIELTSALGPTGIIRSYRPGGSVGVLTGPSFAADIARGLPTALTLACQDETTGLVLQKALTTPNLRIYRTTDVIGAEFGGALKNVIAIAAGAAIGAGLGESARAALMTRGFAEMSRVATHHGARAETLSGLSGFGDLVLTCTSDQSRNYRFGLSLGRESDFDATVTVEGAATARAMRDMALAEGLDMPIIAAVAALIDRELKVTEAMDMLLSRPLKEE